jgi:anti-anti-sigma regulatory factor
MQRIRITGVLDRIGAARASRLTRRAAAAGPVMLDLTSIEGIDSDGAAAVAELQDDLGSQLSLVGLDEAVDRLVGADGRPDPAMWAVRRLHAIAVVQTTPDPEVPRAVMAAALEAALATDASIVVLDLLGTPLPAAGVDAVAFASSTAAVHGQELMLVNVDDATADRLRAAGLSATTFLAPEPLPATLAAP